ncbi:MAG: MarR family winged helix-turn-helix transcriptional regulator [Alphaproteobacteria bacterium]
MPENLVLKDYLPYRLSVLSNRVSSSISKLYQRHVDLSIPEWRVIAILGESGALSAGGVAKKTAMDKVAVSRAAARLVEANYVARKTDAKDKRRHELRLTAMGREIYETVVPVALAYEASLLENLSRAEKKHLDSLLRKLSDIEKNLSH